MASAEQVVVEIIADDSRYDPALKRAARSTREAAADIEKSTNRVGYATRNLGFQLSDIGTQLSGGQSPFIIIGQQAPQVVQALEDIKAAGGSLGQTLSSIALPGFIAVASIAATFAEKMFRGADAAEKKKAAVDALTEAMQRLAGAEATANHETEQGIRDDIKRSETLRQQEHDTRKTIIANLEKAKSDLQAAIVTAKFNPGPEIPGRGVASMTADVQDLNKALDQQNFKIAETDRAILAGHSKLVLRDVKAATDQVAAATQKYEDALDSLQRRFESGKISRSQFDEQAIAITKARDATLKSITDTRRAQSAASREAIAEAKREAAERAKLARDEDAMTLTGGRNSKRSRANCRPTKRAGLPTWETISMSNSCARRMIFGTCRAYITICSVRARKAYGRTSSVWGSRRLRD
jgi:hypothetical protein